MAFLAAFGGLFWLWAPRRRLNGLVVRGFALKIVHRRLFAVSLAVSALSLFLAYTPLGELQVYTFGEDWRYWLPQLTGVPLALPLALLSGISAFLATYAFLGPAGFDSRKPPLGGWPEEAKANMKGWTLMDKPVSVELAVPLKADWRPVDLCRAASLLASSRLRAFELEWDGERLHVYFTAEGGEADRMVEAYKAWIPVQALRRNENYTPKWLEGALQPVQPAFFTAEPKNGTFFTAYDTSRAGELITAIALRLKSARYAWIQAVFVRAEGATAELNRLRDYMRRRYAAETRPIYREGRFVEPASAKKWFAQNWRLLDRHASMKSVSPVAASLRGIVVGMPPEELEEALAIIQDLPLQAVEGPAGRVTDCLAPYVYPASPRTIEAMKRRAVPPLNLREACVRFAYGPRRRNPSALILTAEELGLIVHPPRADVLDGLLTTSRATRIPSTAPMEEEGLDLWKT